MDERHNSKECPTCQTVSPYTISAPRVFSDFAEYISPASGLVIRGRKERVEDMAKTNTRAYETGELQQAEVRTRIHNAKVEQAMDDAVETTIQEMKNE